MNVAKMVNNVFDRAENIVGKGKNAGYIFPFSHNVFIRPFPQMCLTSGLCGKELRACFSFFLMNLLYLKVIQVMISQTKCFSQSKPVTFSTSRIRQKNILENDFRIWALELGAIKPCKIQFISGYLSPNFCLFRSFIAESV